jgi:transcriptional regulator with XRE-family HTH domain
MLEAGRLIRKRRLAHGLTQKQLAIRAGTTQAAISCIERGSVSPSVATVQRLFYVLGEEIELSVKRMESDLHAAHLAAARRRSPEERLELALAWDRFASEVALAGARAREMQR